MGSIFTVALCLITLFSLASCASNARSLAEEKSTVKRSPEGDYRANNNNNKEINRQYTRQQF